MALTKCPECGGMVSDQAEKCPHCGYDIQKYLSNDEEMLKTRLFGISASSIFKRAYDVVLADYIYNNFRTASYLKKVLDISFIDTIQLLKASPVYLYNDVEYEDALYICRQLKNIGIVTAIRDPFGNVNFYAPLHYNKPLPSVDKINRKPWLVKKPKKIEMIEPLGPEPDTYTVHPIGSYNHSITHNGTVTIVNNNHHDGQHANQHIVNHNQQNSHDVHHQQNSSHGNTQHDPNVTIIHPSDNQTNNNGHSLNLKPDHHSQSAGNGHSLHTVAPNGQQSGHSLKPVKKDKR